MPMGRTWAQVENTQRNYLGLCFIHGGFSFHVLVRNQLFLVTETCIVGALSWMQLLTFAIFILQMFV